jgi:acyl carrier protein
MTQILLKQKLSLHFETIDEQTPNNVNLFKGYIDSLDFLKFGYLIAEVANEQGITFDLEDFLYSESYSINEVVSYLEKT